MTDSDLTIFVLREIRDEIRSSNARLESMDTRLESMDTRLQSMDTRLESMDTRLEIVEHTLQDAAGQIQLLVRYVASVATRVTKLEGRTT